MPKNKTISVEKLTNEKWLNLFRATYENEDGKKGHWDYASRKQEPIFGEKPLKPDAIVVVPIYESKRSLVLVKEYRIPIGDVEYGFPAGLCDGEETAEQTAWRETKEETGLYVSEVLHVSPTMISSAGLSDESVKMVFVICGGEISKQGQEENEDIEVSLISEDEIHDLVNQQVKISAKAWPILLLASVLGIPEFIVNMRDLGR